MSFKKIRNEFRVISIFGLSASVLKGSGFRGCKKRDLDRESYSSGPKGRINFGRLLLGLKPQPPSVQNFSAACLARTQNNPKPTLAFAAEGWFSSDWAVTGGGRIDLK